MKSRLKLKNGITVFVRPVCQTDENLFLDLFGKLKTDSIYIRFLSPLGALGMICSLKLTHLNYRDHFALAAVIKEEGKDSIIAVARYGYDSMEDVTDFAVAVRDDWQGLGLGKSLLPKVLMIGREHGIHRFVSIISSSNHIMKSLVRNLGYKVKYSNRTGATQVEISIP